MKNITIKKEKKINLNKDDILFYLINNILLTIITLTVLYPLIYVLSASFSSPTAVAAGKIFLWPVEFGFKGYATVFKNNNVLTGFMNTVIYTCLGTFINVSMTMMAAYPLAKKDLPLKNPIVFLFVFTMLFTGGMIPNYILIIKLNLINTRMALLLPGAIAAYYMIIARTFIGNIPDEMHEAATIDGCSNTRYFFLIVLPLSRAVIAALALFYAVGHWNSYFNAFLYLTDRKLYPLQIILREILIVNQIAEQDITDSETAMRISGMADLLKYSLIVISSVPMLIAYPFVQKHFVKGIMIGSIKG